MLCWRELSRTRRLISVERVEWKLTSSVTLDGKKLRGRLDLQACLAAVHQPACALFSTSYAHYCCAKGGPPSGALAGASPVRAPCAQQGAAASATELFSLSHSELLMALRWLLAALPDPTPW